MDDIKAIDVMNYPFWPQPDQPDGEEIQIMLRTIFKGRAPTPPEAGFTPEQFVAEMDRAGYDKVLITATIMYSWRNKKLIMNTSVDEVYEKVVKKYPDRIIGIAGYNPLKIKESLDAIDRAVKKYGFKGVYFHPHGFNLPPNDRKWYPCYAKCAELGIPVYWQTGHSLEVMPSDPGNPMYVDEVALDFPEVNFMLSHTGWPWIQEFIAMAWKHPNVYCDISSHHPKYLDPALIQFIDTRGQDKTTFGTNKLGLKLCKDQFMELKIRDDTKKKVLRDNAVKIFKL